MPLLRCVSPDVCAPLVHLSEDPRFETQGYERTQEQSQARVESRKGRYWEESELVHVKGAPFVEYIKECGDSEVYPPKEETGKNGKKYMHYWVSEDGPIPSWVGDPAVCRQSNILLCLQPGL